MSLIEEYAKILQQGSNGNLEEKLKKASFYLEERINELQKNFQKFLTETIEKRKKTLPYYKTEMITKDNISIENREMLMELEGKGIINQFFCKSESDDFILFMMVDDKIIFERPYKYFQELSEHLVDIETYKIDDYYYLDMKNFGFIKSVRIYLTTKIQTIFNSILIKYLLYEEKSEN